MQAVYCRGIEQELVNGWEMWIREDLILVGMPAAMREHIRSPVYGLVRCLHLYLTLGCSVAVANRLLCCLGTGLLLIICFVVVESEQLVPKSMVVVLTFDIEDSFW